MALKTHVGVFLGITFCSLVTGYRNFGVTYCLLSPPVKMEAVYSS